MYGLISQMKAQPGERDGLVALLLESVAELPGCRGYVVALDNADPDGLWITELWEADTSDGPSGVPTAYPRPWVEQRRFPALVDRWNPTDPGTSVHEPRRVSAPLRDEQRLIYEFEPNRIYGLSGPR
jgi:Antibiotic biosynthesis monooxygenase